ncbi:hypothetical protein WCD74_22875 [Actinomycetospora sp. OC33-EN08]|uniref:Uncharacterized protein n=1 Tax=Actinomycetospora aurantiaca TaxID=3129233 RepID=A0ABU8MTH5_9PSEU
MHTAEAAGEPRRLPLPPVLRRELEEEHLVFPETLAILGKRRFEGLSALNLRVTDRGLYADGLDVEELKRFALDHAIEVAVSLQTQRFVENPPAAVYSSLEEVENTVLHCGLWATHVVIPDPLFSAVVEERDIYGIGDAAKLLFELRPLIESGLVVPVPAEFIGALSVEEVLHATKKDLLRTELREWVNAQLIVEGPTAREALFITAQDDLDEWPILRTLGRVPIVNDDGTFYSRMLEPYRPDFDYKPWVDQEKTAATRYYVQAVNEKLAQADFFGATYTTRSLFRANLLHKRTRSFATEQALMWTETPIVSDVDFRLFARVADEDEAVADYRSKMGRVLRRAATLTDAAESATDLQEELADQAGKVNLRLHNSALWLSLSASFGLGAVAAGGTPFGWLLAGLGAGSALKDFLPYFEKRKEARLEAPWVWYSLQRKSSTRSRKR